MQPSLLVQIYATLRQPLGTAILASGLCAFGISRILGASEKFRSQKVNRFLGEEHKSVSDYQRDSANEKKQDKPYRESILAKNSSRRPARKESLIGLNRRHVSRFNLRDLFEKNLSREDRDKSEPLLISRYTYAFLAAFCVGLMVFLFAGSLAITVPFTFLSLAIVWIYLRNREARGDKAILQVWPEVVDHLISGIQSGMSLLEAMASLSDRGPEIIRKDFQKFKEEILATGDFSKAVEDLKIKFHSPASDQILEAILMAKLMGGSELLEIFRTLGDFIRQDLALRKEIEIKHGWIKNSAHLSSVAPWLLLLLLSSQPGTVESFSQPGGVLILFLGLAMTLIAYLWMGKLSKLPAPPRVFGSFKVQVGSEPSR